ncbi:sarcosine oxidase gamma subunit [Roseibium sp. TrichSKD4]|uniref:sarcosine oxidase subunit gamma n=1 Tax=Roseibium sp. TrichSKD4 TaxID=744980 RepID=UPI0001E57286|nr:sarcosine oxidase subunit gamma family protein [Roseibium sp. TrichSKD4]EFO29722.1 sarcosine oxidase gamma subunit [Roseibium sp. TrichSKD4]
MADQVNTDLYVPDAGETPFLAIDSVSILKAAPVTRLSFRCRDSSVATAGTAFGVTLPQKPLAAETSPTRIAFWLGPDEWMLIAPEADLESVTASMETALEGQPNALVDVSHRQEAILVSGQKANWLLNTGVPLDLDLAAFPIGTVTRTLFHKSPIMLWRTGEDTYVVEAWVSFMDYVSGLLEQSAGELAAA